MPCIIELNWIVTLELKNGVFKNEFIIRYNYSISTKVKRLSNNNISLLYLIINSFLNSPFFDSKVTIQLSSIMQGILSGIMVSYGKSS